MSQEQDYFLEKIRGKFPDLPDEQLREIVKYQQLQMRQRDLQEYSRRQPKPAPVLEVNWGEVVPTLGAHLSPEFTIRAPGHYAVPFIYFWKDPRIAERGWEEYPVPRHMGNSQWHFYQQLCLEADSNANVKNQYHLLFKIVFPENDGREPYCYCGNMKLVTGVADNSDVSHSIKATGGAVISLYGVKGAMNVDADDNAVLAIDRGYEAKSSLEEDSHCATIPLFRDEDMENRTPRKRLLKPEHAFHEDQRLVLTHPRGKNWHLFAEPEIAIGRHGNNHISLQWLDERRQSPRENTSEYILGTCISRRHCSLSFENEKVYIKDHSTMGTFVKGNPLDRGRNYRTDWEKLPFHFDVAGISRIQLSKCRNRVAISSGKNNKDFPDPEKLYRSVLSHQDGEKDFTHWNLAQNAETDAVRIQRVKKLVAETYKDALTAMIPKECEQREFLRACHTCREDPQADSEEYFVVLRSLSIGCDRRDGIVVNDPGVKKSHARILYCGNGFWVESMKQDGIAVDGVLLKPKELVRLTAGMTLRIGDCELTVSRNTPV